MKRKISLEEYVERMIQEKNQNPRDYSFRLITSKHSKSCHTTFNFPGKYMEALKTNAYTDDGRNLRMDCAQLVQPGGFITRKSTINVEHQSSPLKQDKVETIYDYKLYLIHERNIPSNSIVITNIDPGKQTICYKSHDQIYNVHYIVVTKEEIEKRLNILSYKVKSNKPLSKEEALNFAYIAIFTEENIGKEIITKIVELFTETDEIELKLQLDLHQVLKKMIKYHFKNEENKTRELLTMITEKIYEKNYEELSTYEQSLIDIQERDEIIEKQRNSLIEKDNKLQEKDNTIAEKNTKLQEKDNTIAEKDKIIEDLKKQLNQKNNSK